MFAVLGWMLGMDTEEVVGDRCLAVVGGTNHENVAGPRTAGLGGEQALQQRHGLARAAVADPAVGRHTGQAFGCRQAAQLADFRTEMGEIHCGRYHCSMSSKGRGNSVSTSSAAAASAIIEGGTGSADGGAAGRSGALARRVRSRRAERVRRAASRSAARISSTAANSAASSISPRCLARRRRRASRCSHNEMAGRDRSRVGTSR